MVITVTCPSCAASFPVDSNKVPPAGVNARCSSCRRVFRVERPAEPPPPPPVQPEPAWEPAAPTPEPEPAPPPAEYPEPAPAPTFEAPSFGARPTESTSFEREDFGAGEPSREIGVSETGLSVGGGAAESTREWVYEQETQIDAGSLDIRPLETTTEPVAPPAAAFEPVTIPEPKPPPPPPPAAPEPAQPTVGGFTFGKRDPKDKARRLARVLVSDMIMYNPQRHERALANGTLKQDFEDEIAKSWKEYVDQVGEEMATQNPFWADALNDVLAKGQKIF